MKMGFFPSLLLAWTLLLSSCGSKNSAAPVTTGPVARGTRLLGMDTNDASQDFSFAQSFAAAQSIGVGAATLHLAWNTDETAGSGATSGTFTDTYGALAAANAYYPALPTPAKLSLTLAPIDTGGNFLPSDLSGLPLDNANVVTRFNAFADWTLSHLSNVSLVSVQIGNEIDVPSGASSPLYWSQYKTFVTAVVNHLHSTHPGLKVGVTVSLYGLTGQGSNGATAQNGILSLLGSMDELGLTYYPLDNNFMAKDSTVVITDFEQVFNLVGSIPIYLQEAGYPTGAACGGSEGQQGQFIDQIFSVWDAHAAQMPFVSLLRLNDLSHGNAQSVAASYGLGANTAFVSYLETLGFRTYSSPSHFKSAWTNLQSRTQERGW